MAPVPVRSSALTPRHHLPGHRPMVIVPLALTLVLLVLSLLGCAGSPAPPPGSVPSGSVPPGFVPAGSMPAHGARPLDHALLHPDELGGGWQPDRSRSGTPRWPWAQDDCPGYQDEDYPAQGHRDGAAQRGYVGPAGAALQVVEAYQPGWGVRALDDARRVLAACPGYPFLGGQVTFVVLDVGPTDPDALLARGRIERPGSPATVSYFIAVRRGDIVSTLNLPNPGGERQVLAIAAKLAAHLS